MPKRAVLPPTIILVLLLFSCHLLQVVDSLSTSLRRKTAFVNNLNLIVSHLQNPNLYSTEWATLVKLVKEENDDEEEEEEGEQQEQEQHGGTRKLLVVTRRNVKAGELVTLYPIKCISTDQSDIPLNLLDKGRYPYPLLRSTTSSSIGTEQLYVHSIPSSSSSVLHGWYGNLVDGTKGGILGERGNCVLVPLAGVAPLYGIVATRDIPCGEKLLREVDLEADCDNEIHRIATNVAKAYAFEFAELMSYLQMASNNIPLARSKPLSQQQQQQQQEPSYHCINQQYPNILKIHSNPDIYTVSDFLSQNECERLIAKASLGMQPCLVKNANTGLVEPDPSRTSTNANIPQREVPSIAQKMTCLANCSQEQLEILQVLNYKRGQEFKAHTDGFDSGPTSACGFLDSGRIATVFCYLNDVPEGGTTLFTKLGLEIKPKRGLAVIHFPMSLELMEDERTEHQGSVAIDEKWILTTWVWKHWKGDYRYDEDRLPTLSADII